MPTYLNKDGSISSLWIGSPRGYGASVQMVNAGQEYPIGQAVGIACGPASGLPDGTQITFGIVTLTLADGSVIALQLNQSWQVFELRAKSFTLANSSNASVRVYSLG